MKTILIPVDFSSTSDHVLQYIADASEDIDIGRIILLQTHYHSVYSHDLSSAPYGQSDADFIMEERTEVEQDLRITGQKLLKKCKPGVQVEIAISDLPLLRAIHDMIKDHQPDLLLLGSHNQGYEGDIGESIMDITQISTIPVLIIPTTSEYHKLDSILVPCDFGAISQLSLLQKLLKIQFMPNPELTILNVGPFYQHSAKEGFHRALLKEQLGDSKYKLYYSEEKNIAQGILNFAGKNEEIQLIITLPGRHNFFYKLTHRSITETIALHTQIPLLILKNNAA
jgi:nucleotide-binding universal stress UspA family protein